MDGTLGAVLDSINNRFESAPVRGLWVVRAGEIEPASGQDLSLVDGQFFSVEGSALNDGLHRRGYAGLSPEEFDGTVTPMRVPRELLDIVSEIEEWQASHETTGGPYASESFGGYSYSRATDPATGLPMTWQAAFRSRLNRWRKL